MIPKFKTSHGKRPPFLANIFWSLTGGSLCLNDICSSGCSSFPRSPNSPDCGPAPVIWPTFTEHEQAYLVLDLKPRVMRRYKANKMAFWNEIVPKVTELTDEL